LKELIGKLVDFAESPESNKVLFYTLKAVFVVLVFAFACSIVFALPREKSKEEF